MAAHSIPKGPKAMCTRGDIYKSLCKGEIQYTVYISNNYLFI
jgi:hypothetical protein